MRLTIAAATIVLIGIALIFGSTRSGNEEVRSSTTTLATDCHLYASPSGTADATGTSRNPLPGPTELVKALKEGEVGCLRDGTYRFEELVFDEPNRTITAATGERATLVGRITVYEDAPDTRITDLTLIGNTTEGLPSPVVNADRTLFERVRVTNPGGICFNIGHVESGVPTGVTIQDSVIHDCGRRPSTNFDHGIYVAQATDTVIANNVIRGNVDRGVQLYPNSRGTLVTGNLIVDNGTGVIISGSDEGFASSGNVVERNVIANSHTFANVGTDWPERVGSDNVVRENCVFGFNEYGGIQQGAEGLTVVDNLVVRPGDCPYPVGPR